MEKFLKFFRQHYWFLIYLGGALVTLLALNQWTWPTPDEYFYANVARAFANAQHGVVLWSDINTEHVALVPYLSFLFSWITQLTSFTSSRIPILGFSLGCMVILYVMARDLGLPQKHRIWLPLLLLLIPGFWIFSVRFMLDVPATFSLLLLIWLLIKKAPAYQIAVAVLLILLIKEYYIYLTLPLLVIVYSIDVFIETSKWYRKILRWSSLMLLTYFPTLIAIIILVDFNNFPYPRLLETSLISIFGDGFTAINKAVLFSIHIVWLFYQRYLTWPNSIIKLLEIQIIPVIIPLVYSVCLDKDKRFDYRWIIAWVGLVIISIGFWFTMQDTNMTIPIKPVETTLSTQPIPDTVDTVLEQKINTIQFSGIVPTGAFDSQISSPAHTWWEKIWLIYRYNFSESDIHIFILPLAILGMIVSLFTIAQHRQRHKLTAIRTDLIVWVFLGLMLYFNWHEANNIHGFRVTIPIIIPLLYFAYLGSRQLLKKLKYPWMVVFTGLMIISLILYFITLRDLEYHSSLAQVNWASQLLAIKPYLFIGLFIVFTGIIVWFPRIRLRSKYTWLLLCVIGLFILKIFPYYLEHRSAINLYGYDYGLAGAEQPLAQLARRNKKIYSNVHDYKVQYYAQDIRIANGTVHPIFRSFSANYPVLYYVWPIDTELLEHLKSEDIHYIFIINDRYDQAHLKLIQNLAATVPAVSLLDQQSQGDRVQWALYYYSH